MAPTVSVPGLQGQAEPFALFHHDSIEVTLFPTGSADGAFLGVSIGKQQEVRNIFVAGGALLRQIIGPVQQLQHRTNQFLLGYRLVGVLGTRQGVILLADSVPERLKLRRRRDGFSPLRRGFDAVGEEVVCE